MPTIDLSQYGISVQNVLRNAQPSVLYEQALTRGEGEIVSSGALAARSGDKTGRSPKDKRIVDAAPIGVPTRCARRRHGHSEKSRGPQPKSSE